MSNTNRLLSSIQLKLSRQLQIAGITLSCIVTSLYSQTNPPASVSATNTSSTTSGNGDQAVVLSAFEVNDTKDTGYFPTESVSGLKTKQGLLDQPGNITVVPRDLINDIGELESASDTLKYVASDVNPYVRGENMQIRGQRTGFTLVDDIPDLMFYADNAGVDSYEVLKGPTAVLYGPAPSIFGLVIKTQKRPLPVASDDVSLTVGDTGFIRTDIDLTGPLAKGFSYRLIGAYQRQPDKDPLYFDNRQILIGTLQWTDGSTTIRASYEHANIEYGIANYATVDNYEVGSKITPYVGPFGRYFNYAPTTFGFYGLYSNDVRFTGIHEFNENWQTKIFYDRSLTDRPSVEEPDMTSYSIVNNTFTLGYFDYDENFISTVYGIDNIGKYNFAGIQFQTNFGYLYNNREGADQTFLYVPSFITGSFTNPPNFNSYTPPPDTRVKADNYIPGPSDTYYAMETIDPIPNSDRLILDAGLSRIKVPGVGGGLTVYDTVYRAGAVVKVTDGISVYGSYATRFNPTSFTNRDINGNIFPNQQGKGGEVGVKTDLFNHRLIITADYYKLENTNVTNYTGLISPVTGLGYNVLIGSTVDTGYELDARLEIAKNWQLIVVGWEGKNLNSAGIEQDNAIKESAAFFTKFSFADVFANTWAHGLSIGGGTYYSGDRFFESTHQYIPNHFVTNAFVNYVFNRHWRVSFNVQNVFDLWYIEGAWARNIPDYGEPRTLHMTLDHRF